MTDLRFGTETGQSPRVTIRNLASVRGEWSHRVTPFDPLKRDALARGASGHLERACSRWVEDRGGADEVGNLKGVGAGLRSGSQVQSDRHPEVPRAGHGRILGCEPVQGASTRGEGFGPTTESARLGGGEGQESIGSAGRLTARTRARTLSRSKALKSKDGERELADPNGTRAEGVERRHGWLGGKGSEGRYKTPRAGVA
jgi:hypothetical protein